jgi:hypothetical protein
MKAKLLGRTTIVPWLLAAAVVATSVLVSSSAQALILDFSATGYTGYGDTVGTVTGEIVGLSDNFSGPATPFLVSVPAQWETYFAPPNTLDATAPPWVVLDDDFEVANGDLVYASFISELGDIATLSVEVTPLSDGCCWTLSFQPSAVVFSGSLSTAPIPPAGLLFGMGLALFGLLGCWSKTRVTTNRIEDQRFA